MKKIFLFFLCLSLIAPLSACSLPEETEGLSIVATNFPLYDFAKQIVADNATITLLLKPGEESHSYEPTPQDMQKIRHADLFLCIGGESEAWVDTVLKGADMKDVPVLRLIEFVTPLTTNGAEDSHHHTYDEHIWTSPKNAISMTEAIAARLKEIAPEYKEAFAENTAAFGTDASNVNIGVTGFLFVAGKTEVNFAACRIVIIVSLLF